MKNKALIKKIAAFGLATAMTVSTLYVPNTALTVYADEVSEEAAEETPLWSDSSTTLTFKVGSGEGYDTAWDGKTFATNTGVEVGTKLKITAKVTVGDISGLSEEETLFQL